MQGINLYIVKLRCVNYFQDILHSLYSMKPYEGIKMTVDKSATFREKTRQKRIIRRFKALHYLRERLKTGFGTEICRLYTRQRAATIITMLAHNLNHLAKINFKLKTSQRK